MTGPSPAGDCDDVTALDPGLDGPERGVFGRDPRADDPKPRARVQRGEGAFLLG